jgi:magnesium transporter
MRHPTDTARRAVRQVTSTARNSLGSLLRPRTVTPGTAPGTLRPRDQPPEFPVEMQIVRYDPEHLVEAELHSVADLDKVPEEEMCWIDVVGHDVDLVARLGERLDVHPLALEDVVNVGQRPKVEDYGPTLFVVLDLIQCRDPGPVLVKEQVSLVIQEGLLLSFREQPGAVFDPVRVRLRNGVGRRIRTMGADYLAYALVDTVVDHVFPVLDRIGERIETIETSLLEDPAKSDLDELHRLKRDLLLMRRSVWPLRDAVGSLVRGDHDLIAEETRVFLRDVGDHVAHAIDVIETYREMASSLVDLYLSSVSNRMNEVMKVLTIIATIFIPLSFVAGLYGMNFDREASPWNMPELGWYWGYPAALAVMVGIALALLVFFRRKGWI